MTSLFEIVLVLVLVIEAVEAAVPAAILKRCRRHACHYN